MHCLNKAQEGSQVKIAQDTQKVLEWSRASCICCTFRSMYLVFISALLAVSSEQEVPVLSELCISCIWSVNRAGQDGVDLKVEDVEAWVRQV